MLIFNFKSYTSYDYGAAVAENRMGNRTKYSEEKLLANLFKACPAYLETVAGPQGNGTYGTPTSISVTALMGNKTSFFVIRHADFTNTSSTAYKITLPTSSGNITIPQLGGSLTLYGRDSKICPTDLSVGNTELLYSTAEVLAQANSGSTRVLLLYGGLHETHEFAVPNNLHSSLVAGTDVKFDNKGSHTIAQWQVTPDRNVVKFGDVLIIHLLPRNEAYEMWPMKLKSPEPIGAYSSPSKEMVIIKAGYLVRSASVSGDTLTVLGDVNSTTDVEILAAPSGVSRLQFNGKAVSLSKSKYGTQVGSVSYVLPKLQLPDLLSLEWRYIDSLPEVGPGYNDAAWTICMKNTTTSKTPLITPTSLIAGDYGYSTGSLLYRGHFTSTGNETEFNVTTQGGEGYGHSIWINDTFVGSWYGNGSTTTISQVVTLPKLTASKRYVITLLIDHMGLEENSVPGNDNMKTPRGILDYDLVGHADRDLTWVMTGNLGGEDYQDMDRGPLNEGATFAERQGYHQPDPPSGSWEHRSPSKVPGIRPVAPGS
jgi:hypothetical protein